MRLWSSVWANLTPNQVPNARKPSKLTDTVRDKTFTMFQTFQVNQQ